MAKKKRRARKLIDDVTAILFISPNAKRLCEFYRSTLRLPLEDERHDGMPLHYGCDFGAVHVAIHPASRDWPGVRTRKPQSPVINFSTADLKAVGRRLAARGVKTLGPTDHGFATALSFRDPDGNAVTILEYAPEYW
jgi:catechol-2,3-dioxygenase